MTAASDKHSPGQGKRGRHGGSLVLAVVVATLVLLSMQYLFAMGYLEAHVQDHLEGHLRQVLNLARSPAMASDPAQALRRAREDPLAGYGEGRLVHTYGLDPSGRVLVPPRRPGLALPPPAVLAGLARGGPGGRELTIQGRPAWAAVERLPGGGLVVVSQGFFTDYLQPALGPLIRSSLLATLGLVVLIVLLGAFVARRRISRPLRRLTAEAERVASGDLTPPPPLAGRGDELGRLSLALNHMTLAAQRMVGQAALEQARFQRLFNDSKDGAFITDQQGRLVEVNEALMEMLGCTDRAQLMGKDQARELFLDPEEGRLYGDTLAAQGYVQDFPAVLRRLDGSSFEALLTVTDAKQSHIRFGLIRDVTRMRAAQRALVESEARYRRLVDNAPDIIYRWSFEQNRFEYLSTSAQEITGYSPQRLVDSPALLWQVVHPEDRRRVRRQWLRLMRGRGPAVGQQEFRILTAEGGARWLMERSILLRDELDHPLALEGIATDITDRKLVELELVRGQQMVEDTLQGLPAAVMVLDREHKVAHWNRALEALTGVPAEQVVGSNRQWHPFYPQAQPVLADLILEGQDEQIKHLAEAESIKPSKLVEGGWEGEGFYPGLGEKGTYLYFLAAPIRDAEGRVVRAVETLVDLTDKRSLEQELVKLSVTDNLTGLYNQRFFYASLGREMETSQRYDLPLSLLMADIDLFKSFNDSFGHLAGDQALSQFAEVLGRCVRGMDLCCRYGGEEFVVLLPHAALPEAMKVAERVRAGVAGTVLQLETNEGQRTTSRITVSLGVATLGAKEDAQELVRRADAALYAAKEAGRNLVGASLAEGQVQVLPRGTLALAPPPEEQPASA
ncbi:MAG: diguanylate cyclase [Desulfarculus sp.]|nr:MAG: diguanylate cyclase [Desulfarculus sp.]